MTTATATATVTSVLDQVNNWELDNLYLGIYELSENGVLRFVEMAHEDADPYRLEALRFDPVSGYSTPGRMRVVRTSPDGQVTVTNPVRYRRVLADQELAEKFYDALRDVQSAEYGERYALGRGGVVPESAKASTRSARAHLVQVIGEHPEFATELSNPRTPVNLQV